MVFSQFHLVCGHPLRPPVCYVCSLQSICLPLKLDCCGAESGCALLRLNRNTSGITLFQISIPRPCRRKTGSLPGESHVIPCPAGGSLSLDCTSLSLSVLASTEQCRPSGLPGRRRSVGSGTNFAGCHICFHTHCSPSHSSQVSTVTNIYIYKHFCLYEFVN